MARRRLGSEHARRLHQGLRQLNGIVSDDSPGKTAPAGSEAILAAGTARASGDLARDTVAAEKKTNEVPREEQGKTALTELLEAIKTDQTPIIVENIVIRIDEVVRAVRFEGWQSTIRGDQEVRQALRKTLDMQFKIRDNDVFEKALGYIREYY